MPGNKTPTASLEEMKARFEEWRRNRKRKASVPDELWARLSQWREGKASASTELRAEWNHLKRRMATTERTSSTPSGLAPKTETTTPGHPARSSVVGR